MSVTHVDLDQQIRAVESALGVVGWLDRDGLESTLETLKRLNTPELDNFALGVVAEAQFQRAKWGEIHDRAKSSEQWFWLVGYLAGKGLRASLDGNREKALHHCISSAAALANWHEAIRQDETNRGLAADPDMQRIAADQGG